MLTTQYEGFSMKKSKTIQEMHTKFTSITNELHCLGEVIPPSKQVKKKLRVLPKLWKSKVNAISEARDLRTLTMDELIGNIKTYELKKQQDQEKKEPKKEKYLTLKASKSQSSEKDEDVAFPTQINSSSGL